MIPVPLPTTWTSRPEDECVPSRSVSIIDSPSFVCLTHRNRIGPEAPPHPTARPDQVSGSIRDRLCDQNLRFYILSKARPTSPRSPG